MIALLCATSCFASDFNPTNATFDELLFNIQRYGNTDERLARKKASRKEFRRRGKGSLEYLMTNIHIQNIWIRIMAQQVVERTEGPEVADVLVQYLDSEHEDTRKFATYFLGFKQEARYADRVIPMLEDEKAAASAIRTLGKWGVTDAIPVIVPFLEDEDERKRIMVVNALWDIGDPMGVPYLIDALDDPYFTVRNAAARALVTIGKPAEKPMLKVIRKSDTVAKRQMIRILGDMQAGKAKGTLKKLLKDPDPGVRADAQVALDLIEGPRDALKKGSRSVSIFL